MCVDVFVRNLLVLCKLGIEMESIESGQLNTLELIEFILKEYDVQKKCLGQNAFSIKIQFLYEFCMVFQKG